MDRIKDNLEESRLYKLLTKKDLAARWQISEQVIDDYRAKGIITAVKGLMSVKSIRNI